MITFDIIAEDPNKEKQGLAPRLNFNKGDYVRLNELLSNVNWEAEFEGKSTRERWEIFPFYYRKFVKECRLCPQVQKQDLKVDE